MLLANRIMFLESSLFTAAMVVAAVVCGLLAGGRAYTGAWRIAHGRRPIGERSRCPSCGHELTIRERIPVVSWLMLHGSCGHCGAPISMAYPASELLGAGIFASVVLRHGPSIETLETLAFAFLLMIVAMTSLMDYRIPNACMAWAVVVRLAYLVAVMVRGGDFSRLLVTSCVGAVALGVPLFVSVWMSNRMLAREVTGIGTVKLVTVVGFYLGWQQGLICIAIAVAIGLVVWVVSPSKLMPVEVEGGALDPTEQLPSPRELRASRDEDIAEPMRLIPFAPSIAIACWIMLLLGVAPAMWNTPIF